MTKQNNGWRELFTGGNTPKVLVFAGGVGLNAMEVYIGSTLMPSVVADIGGLQLFAWVTTVFIIASIIASIFAAVRPFGLGPRQNYLIAATAFALGSLICGLAPSMPVLLIGRAVQGFGAGLLAALTFFMVRLVFPEHLWARAFGLASAMWGIATFVGPAIGGVFAEFHAWRWAFFVLVPAAALVGAGAMRIVPPRSSEPGMTRLPYPQIGLIIAAIVALSLASALAASTHLAIALTVGAVAAILALALIEGTATTRLLPTGTFKLNSKLGALFASLFLLQMAIGSDIFIPLFLQGLHGVGPLTAGYMVALLAVGWSTSSMLTSGWTDGRARQLILWGPVILLGGALGLALTVAHESASTFVLLPIGLSLLLMGVGIGIASTQLTPRVMQAAPDGEQDVTSAALSTLQLFAGGASAALGGLIVNLGGLSAPVPSPLNAAGWLYWLYVALPLLAIPACIAVARREAAATAAIPQPAE